ncbi:hypothetical protein BGZ73_005247 [Actinomortierella ambigua]|nr:hypothetical protein BGZ73_005247 [Actinomortierella ambigua]
MDVAAQQDTTVVPGDSSLEHPVTETSPALDKSDCDNPSLCLPETSSFLQDALIELTGTTLACKAEAQVEGHLPDVEELLAQSQLYTDDQQTISLTCAVLPITLSPPAADKKVDMPFEQHEPVTDDTLTCRQLMNAILPQSDDSQSKLLLALYDQQGQLDQQDQRDRLSPQHHHVQQTPPPPQQQHGHHSASPSPSPSVSPAVPSLAQETIPATTLIGTGQSNQMATTTELHRLAKQDLVSVLQDCQKTLSLVQDRAKASLEEVFQTAHIALQVVRDSMTVSLPNSCSSSELENGEQSVSLKEEEDRNVGNGVIKEAVADEFVIKVQDELESDEDGSIDAKKSSSHSGQPQSGAYDRHTPKNGQNSRGGSAATDIANDDRIRFLPRQRERDLSVSPSPSITRREQSPATRAAARGADVRPKDSLVDSFRKRKRSDSESDEVRYKDQVRKRPNRDAASRSSDTVRAPNKQQDDRGYNSQRGDRNQRHRDSRNVASSRLRYGCHSSSSSSPPTQTRGSLRTYDRYIPRYNRLYTSDVYRPTARDTRHDSGLQKKR